MAASNLEDIRVDVAREQRDRLLRSLGLVVVATIVVVGALGGLGVRSRRSAAQQGSLQLQVDYPRVARGGLAVPLDLRISRPGGFAGEVVVSMSSGYLDALDVNALVPEPAASTASDDLVTWTFDPPPGDVLVVRFDARIEPGARWWRRASVVASVGASEVRVEVATWIAP